MSERRNANQLLIAETPEKAVLAGWALGLDPSEWLCVGMCAALCGRGFSKIVVLPPPRPMTAVEAGWLHMTFATRTLRGATTHLL